MATTRLNIEEKKITWHDGRYFEYLSEDGRQFVGNGWHVCIDADEGIIHCWSARQYSTGWAVYEKVYKLQDGLIGLSGGDVRQRYTYFRSARLQHFLNEHSISAVERIDPNGEYILDNCWTGRGTKKNSIRTDGVVEEIELETSDWKNTCAWESRKTVRVTGASWVIVDSYVNYGDNHSAASVLKTLQNVLSIKSIPNEAKRRQWHRDLQKVMEAIDSASATKESVVEFLKEHHYHCTEVPSGNTSWRHLKDGSVLKVNHNYDDSDYAVIMIKHPYLGDDVLRVYPENKDAFMDY